MDCNMEISVIKLKPVTMGNLKAFAEIKIGEITICDCRIVQQPGQKAYVSGPQKNENNRWIPLVKMSRTLKEQVETIVLEAARKQNIIA